MTLLKKTDDYIKKIKTLENFIMEQKKISNVKILAKVVANNCDFFKKTIAQLNKDLENESDSGSETFSEFSEIASENSNEASTGDVSSEETKSEIYSETESEYEFDETDIELKTALKEKMLNLHNNNRDKHYDNLKLSKPKNMF